MSINSTVKISNFQRPVELLEIANRGQQPAARATKAGGSFKEMFSEQLAATKEVSFSKHASQRLFSRGIELSDAQLSRIADAIDQAEAKGDKGDIENIDVEIPAEIGLNSLVDRLLGHGPRFFS